MAQGIAVEDSVPLLLIRLGLALAQDLGTSC
jgi:hypothetical protein